MAALILVSGIVTFLIAVAAIMAGPNVELVLGGFRAPPALIFGTAVALLFCGLGTMIHALGLA